MEVITSNKGGQKLILGGFMYTKQLTQPRKIRWRCVKRTTNCKASLTTTLDLEDPQLLSAHNHDPSDSSVSAVKCRAQMKQQASFATTCLRDWTIFLLTLMPLTVLVHTEGFNVTRMMLSCSVVFLPCSNPPCGTYTKLRLRVSREPTITVKPGTTE